MKKYIILTLLAFVALAGIAQPKTDTVKKITPPAKPEFKVDPAKSYHLVLDLLLDDIGILTANPDDWKGIKSSPQLSGQQITAMENRATDLRKMIFEQVRAIQLADMKRFQDSVTAAGMVKPVKK